MRSLATSSVAHFLLTAGLVCLLGVAVQPANAQIKAQADSSNLVDLLVMALQRGSVDDLLDGSSGRIELSVLGEGGNYSKRQASQILQQFFRSYPASRVSLTNGLSTEGEVSMSGRYWLEGADEAMNITISVRLDDQGKSALESLRITEVAYRRVRSGR